MDSFLWLLSFYFIQFFLIFFFLSFCKFSYSFSLVFFLSRYYKFNFFQCFFHSLLRKSIFGLIQSKDRIFLCAFWESFLLFNSTFLCWCITNANPWTQFYFDPNLIYKSLSLQFWLKWAHCWMVKIKYRMQ